MFWEMGYARNVARNLIQNGMINSKKINKYKGLCKQLIYAES